MENIQDLIKKHEDAIKLLEGIQVMKNRVESYKESLRGVIGTIPSSKEKYLKKMNDAKDVALRLIQSYEKNFK